jgi:hypothetical protein
MAKRVLGGLVAAMMLAACGAGSARAEDAETARIGAAHALFVSELRGGVLYHDAMGREGGVDINLEILGRFAAVEFETPLLGTRGMLRPHLGGNLNTAGDISSLYFGYSLTVDLTDWLFVEGSLGGMVHNGNTRAGVPGKLALGCNLLFREAASLGVRLTDAVNVTAMVEHSSNTGACNANNGLTNMGVRLGYMF